MKIKKNKDNKTMVKSFRVNQFELNRMQLKANIYCEGNLSQWIIYSSLNYKPKGKDIDKK
jgi:hypothetical protein